MKNIRILLAFFFVAPLAWCQLPVPYYPVPSNVPVSVLDYNAKCDGSTADHAAFAAALAGANNVVVPWSFAGCNIGSGIVLGSSQTLDCNGTTLLVASNNAKGITLSGSSAQVHNCSLALLGSPTGATGVYVGSASAATNHNVIREVTVTGAGFTNGLWFYGNSFGNYWNRVYDFTSISAATGILFSSDTAGDQPDREYFEFPKVLYASANAVDITNGATEQFYGLDVENSVNGVNIRNNSGNGQNFFQGYIGENNSGKDLILAGAYNLYNVFQGFVAGAGQIQDLSGGNTNSVYTGLTPGDQLGGFQGTLGATAFASKKAWQWSGSTVFGNGTANLVAYVDFGNVTMFGAVVDVSVSGSYDYADGTGVVSKSMQLFRSAGGAIGGQFSRVTQADGNTPLEFAIGDFVVDGANHLKIPIYDISANGDTAYIAVSGLFSAPVVNPTIVAAAVVSNSQGRQVASSAALLPGAVGEAKPTCAAAYEGYPYYTPGSGGTNGALQVCQNQSGSFSWVTH